MDWVMTIAIVMVCLVIVAISSALSWEIMQDDN